jgi:hypothetical protein
MLIHFVAHWAPLGPLGPLGPRVTAEGAQVTRRFRAGYFSSVDSFCGTLGSIRILGAPGPKSNSRRCAGYAQVSRRLFFKNCPVLCPIGLIGALGAPGVAGRRKLRILNKMLIRTHFHMSFIKLIYIYIYIYIYIPSWRGPALGARVGVPC